MMVEWIVSSSALIIIVIALRYILRGRVSLRVQYALWALVLVRLLVPFSFGHSGVSIMNAAERLPTVRAARSVGGYDRLNYTSDGAVRGYRYGSSEPEQVADGSTEEEFIRMNAAVAARDVFIRIWIIGSAVTLTVILASNLRFGRVLRRGRRALDADCPLPVYVSERVQTPCLFGLLRPKIYVTPRAAENETELRHVLTHETTHSRHGDNIWSALRCLCVCVHWFNPLVWWAAVLSRQDGELCCDEDSVRALGESEREAYGLTIIKCTCPGRSGAILCTATTMTGSKRSLKERITLLAKKPRTRVYAAVIAALALVLAAGCAFTGAAAKPADPVSAQPVSGGADAGNMPVSADYASAELLSDKSKYDEYTDDQPKYEVRIAFTANEIVTGFKYFHVVPKDGDDSKVCFETASPVYTQPKLSPGRLLVIDTVFEGNVPTRAVSYKDASGGERYFTVGISGSDGAVVLTELIMQNGCLYYKTDALASPCPYNSLKFSGRDVNTQKYDRSYTITDVGLINEVWALVKPGETKNTGEPETAEIGIDMYFYNAEKMEFFTLFPTDYLKDQQTGNFYRLEAGTYGRVSSLLTEYTENNYSFSIDRNFISIDTASPEKLTFMVSGSADPITVSPSSVGDFTAGWNLKQITPKDGDLGGEVAYIQNVYTKEGFGPVELGIYFDLKLLAVNFDGMSGYFSMDDAAVAVARNVCGHVSG